MPEAHFGIDEAEFTGNCSFEAQSIVGVPPLSATGNCGICVSPIESGFNPCSFLNLPPIIYAQFGSGVVMRDVDFETIESFPRTGVPGNPDHTFHITKTVWAPPNEFVGGVPLEGASCVWSRNLFTAIEATFGKSEFSPLTDPPLPDNQKVWQPPHQEPTQLASAATSVSTSFTLAFRSVGTDLYQFRGSLTHRGAAMWDGYKEVTEAGWATSHFPTGSSDLSNIYGGTPFDTPWEDWWRRPGSLPGQYEPPSLSFSIPAGGRRIIRHSKTVTLSYTNIGPSARTLADWATVLQSRTLELELNTTISPDSADWVFITDTPANITVNW